VAATVLLVLIAAVAVAAPALAPHDPNDTDLIAKFAEWGEDGHLLGTDDLGRDAFSRLLYGTRITLVAPFIAVGVALVLGLPTGLLAGFRGGIVDAVLGRVSDALLALPGLVLAIAVVAARGPGTVNAMTAVGIAFAPRVFRIVRGATLGVRAETFIEASRAAGASSTRLIGSHVLPNILPPLIVQVSVMLGFAVLTEAGLSFLGIGVQPPDASWGVLLRRGFDHLQAAPLLSFPPGLMIMVLTLCFQFIGDGLRDSLGKEIRRER
jgi:peptide/nickel transport system permease protein